MSKKVLLAIGLSCLTGMLPAYGGQTEQRVTEIRVTLNQNENYPQYLVMEDFGEKSEKATNSRYHMTIYPSGALGGQGTMAELIRIGALQMVAIPDNVPEGYDADFATVGVPYLYDDIDHLEHTAMGGVSDELFSSAGKYKFRALTVHTAGERSVYAEKPTDSVDDLKDTIIRVNDSSTYVEMTKLMDGSGAIMAQSEVYTALQQDVINTAEDSELVCRDFKSYEITPYYTYIHHIAHPDAVLTSTDLLDSVSDGDRAIFDQLIKESIEKEFTLFKETVEQAKKDTEATNTRSCYPGTEGLRGCYMLLLRRIAEQSDVVKKIYAGITTPREGE